MLSDMINNVLTHIENSTDFHDGFIKLAVTIVSSISATAAYLSFRTNTKTLTQNKRNRLIDCAESLIEGTMTKHEEIKLDIAFYDYSNKIIDMRCLKKILKSDLPHRNLDHLARAGELFKHSDNKLIISKKNEVRANVFFLLNTAFFIAGVFIWILLYNFIPYELQKFDNEYSTIALLALYIMVVIISSLWAFFVVAITYPKAERYRSIKQLKSL